MEQSPGTSLAVPGKSVVLTWQKTNKWHRNESIRGFQLKKTVLFHLPTIGHYVLQLIICALIRINIKFKDFPGATTAVSYKIVDKVFNNAIKTVLDNVQTLNAV